MSKRVSSKKGRRVISHACASVWLIGLSQEIEPMEIDGIAEAHRVADEGQPMQIDLATPRASQIEPQRGDEVPDPAAVFTWSEEKLLELATSLPAMRTIKHQPRGLRQTACVILKKLLQHPTHCHHQWVKKHDSESLQAEIMAARWAWLGPTLLMRAYEGGEQADGMRRKG